ncbi:MAG: hypothetical protein HY551_07600 [Elusimicrobia bacterium]|nr:hypothetical protein [Elusimicrobiota bacterium]
MHKTSRSGPLYRIASPEDAPAIARLDRTELDDAHKTRRPLDPGRLSEEMRDNRRVWALSQRGGEILAAVSITLEAENRLGKIHRMLAAPFQDNRHELLNGALALLMQELRRRDSVDVVYCTTRTVTLEQQELTLEHGFKVLGVFPSAVSADPSKLNGLSVWYAPDVLSRKRYSGFAIHPAVEPFYALARRACGLGELPKASIPRLPDLSMDLPAIERIEAPLFVAEKFRGLRERRKLSVNFYPFQTPNVLFTSPDQGIEVFAAFFPATRFAAILGEHITVSVNPIALYRALSDRLHEYGVAYIEIINDASDASSIEAILRAGYAPCGYFPCLRSDGETRRDYVVFARSLERTGDLHPAGPKPYARYLQEFCAARSSVS